MFNKTSLKDVLVKYKQDFISKRWNCQKFKLEAVKCFQDNWNINTSDFADMLARSLEKTCDLIVSANNFPVQMIIGFAKIDPEKVGAMFIDLFNEELDIYERINNFKIKSYDLLEKYGNGAENHYQNENVISMYLWLRFPSKYYIYEFCTIKSVSEKLKSNYVFNKDFHPDNIKNFYKLYDEICNEVKSDEELVELFKNQIDDTCYKDPELKALTCDVCFYIEQYYESKNFEDDKKDQRNKKDFDIVRDKSQLKNKHETYTKKDFLEEVYMSEQQYENLVMILKNKKNIILQGAPGVGKTFAAKRLAYSIMGKKDESRIEFVQFHQNYSYEDFVMGYKPAQDGFELRQGVFYRFCKKADSNPEKDFFFIIDEINRGNVSKIFGELLMLIERDYRGTSVTLAYNGTRFSVPENIYIIGMMNTADRSLAMIDYALRRRFSFVDVDPGFDSDGFIQYKKILNDETFDELIEKVKDLNKEIILDRSLGKGFCIGHSYFCGRDLCSRIWLQTVVNYDIIPMLSEYWFDDETRLQRWKNILNGVFQ